VESALMKLPPKYRVVLMLRDIEQLSGAEAAAALGLGIPAMKARLFRARLILREALAPHFISNPRRMGL
jgi:RNA polymerase sigma-70 factor (ECF subfamily)